MQDPSPPTGMPRLDFAIETWMIQLSVCIEGKIAWEPAPLRKIARRVSGSSYWRDARRQVDCKMDIVQLLRSISPDFMLMSFNRSKKTARLGVRGLGALNGPQRVL